MELAASKRSYLVAQAEIRSTRRPLHDCAQQRHARIHSRALPILTLLFLKTLGAEDNIRTRGSGGRATSSRSLSSGRKVERRFERGTPNAAWPPPLHADVRATEVSKRERLRASVFPPTEARPGGGPKFIRADTEARSEIRQATSVAPTNVASLSGNHSMKRV
jgi:hypothetical protein